MGNFAVARLIESGRDLTLVFACADFGFAFTEVSFDFEPADLGLGAALLAPLLADPTFLAADLEGFFTPLFFFSKEIDSLRNNLASFSNLTVPVRTRWEAALLPFSDFSRSDTTLDKSSLNCLYVSFIDMPRTPPFRVIY